ncbi:MAG: site-2 protease family protein, partial [Leptolyngbyaceae cyanobacterium bins.59]|nr:site-2 protease family protein [Leptolyngbyaceae cyanobacterium bins.59]
MQAGWRVGTIFGIPFYINPSWIFVLFFLTLVYGQNWQQLYPEWGPILIWGGGLLVTLLLFTSLLLHELGHSMVARFQGITVNSITLFLFGGVASIEKEATTPGKAFQVAIAGPAVSLTLFGVLTGLSFLFPETNPFTILTRELAQINLILAIFNLIPGLPLDGGQILKAAIWKVTGDRFQGTRWAARAGQFIGGLAIVLGLTALVLLRASGGLWMALIGWFVIRNASLYDRLTTMQEVLLKVRAVDAMTREFRVVDADLSIRRFADDYLLQESALPPAYFAASDGRYRGLVNSADISQVERSQWETQTLWAILQPLDQVVSVAENTPIVEVINQIEAHELKRITVLSPAGTVSGVIDRGDIVRVVTKSLNMPI